MTHRLAITLCWSLALMLLALAWRCNGQPLPPLPQTFAAAAPATNEPPDVVRVSWDRCDNVIVTYNLNIGAGRTVTYSNRQATGYNLWTNGVVLTNTPGTNLVIEDTGPRRYQVSALFGTNESLRTIEYVWPKPSTNIVRLSAISTNGPMPALTNWPTVIFINPSQSKFYRVKYSGTKATTQQSVSDPIKGPWTDVAFWPQITVPNRSIVLTTKGWIE